MREIASIIALRLHAFFTQNACVIFYAMIRNEKTQRIQSERTQARKLFFVIIILMTELMYFPSCIRLDSHNPLISCIIALHLWSQVEIDLLLPRDMLTCLFIDSRNVNIARNKSAFQSSTNHGGLASKAVDGIKNTQFDDGSCTHTNRTFTTNDEWLYVDLGYNFDIQRVVVHSGMSEYMVTSSNMK